jgi:predicted nuclease with TOPRIM domain
MVEQAFKGRYCNIYFPSEEDRKRWQDWAKEAGVPLSKFVYETVERYKNENLVQPRTDLVKEMDQLREENNRIRAELKTNSLVIQKLETENFKLRHETFLENEFRGSRQLSNELVDLLKSRACWRSEDLLKALNIDAKDIDPTRIINRQLTVLHNFGLIEETPRGWTWRT